MAADPEYYNAWIELGLTYEVQKNYVDAERVFSNLVDLGIANQQILFRLVELNLKLNNPDQALSYILQAADDPALILDAANLLLSRDFYDHAAEILDPMSRENPIPVDALFFWPCWNTKAVTIPKRPWPTLSPFRKTTNAMNAA